LPVVVLPKSLKSSNRSDGGDVQRLGELGVEIDVQP
jgi:hypothetical protein